MVEEEAPPMWRRATDWLTQPANAAATIATLVVVTYVGVVMARSFGPAFQPFVAETDWKAAVWPYYRYYIDGAFPPGNLMTDRALVMHAPPLWWLPMATLSTFMPPVFAANLLNFVAFIGTLVALYYVVRGPTNHWMALASVALLAREAVWWRVTAGGYARSFGPGLVLVFLAFWMRGKHRAVLVTLVVQAALYPSVVVPCGLAYGAWVLFKADPQKLRRIAELAVAGVLVITMGKISDLRSPDWWGPLITLEEAKANPATHRRGGRSKLYPLRGIPGTMWGQATRSLSTNGHRALDELGDFNRKNGHVLILALAMTALVVVLLRRLSLPPHLIVLILAAFLAYLVARAVAFKLYLPRRMLQHTWPYLFLCLLPILYHRVCHELLGRRKALATALAVGLTLGPIFVLYGDGLGRRSAYRSYKNDADLHEFLQTLPLDATFAGTLAILTEIPLFSQRQVYVSWKLALPHRGGYFAEVERRLDEMYAAIYASDLDDVVDFAEREDIDYFVIDRRAFKRVEKGDSQLFEPSRSKAVGVFKQNKDLGFALQRFGEPAKIYSQKRRYDVYSVEKLKELVGSTD